MPKAKAPKAGNIDVQVTQTREAGTITLTASDPDEDISFNIDHSGGGTQRIAAHTDENGEATVEFVPSSPGNYSVTVSSDPHIDDVAGPVAFNVPF
jgi:hypothetical protein